jgi:hypothetical protein
MRMDMEDLFYEAGVDMVRARAAHGICAAHARALHIALTPFLCRLKRYSTATSTLTSERTPSSRTRRITLAARPPTLTSVMAAIARGLSCRGGSHSRCGVRFARHRLAWAG